MEWMVVIGHRYSKSTFVANKGEDTPRLNDKTDLGKSHLQDLAQWLRTSQRVDIQKISQFYWAFFEKTRFLCFYIIKSMARKGYFGPKSDSRGSKIAPRGASLT